MSNYIDPPEAYSNAGRQPFQNQQTKIIRYATQEVGRRSGAGAPRVVRAPKTGEPAGVAPERGGRSGHGRGGGRNRGQ